MNKKLATIAITALLSHGAAPSAHVRLDSPLLDFIDGKSYGINGKVYGLILQVRKNVREMLLGKKNEDKKLVGLYTFEGKTETIASLAKKEQSIYNSGDPAKIEALKKLLGEIKEDFLEITKGYVENIKPFKTQIYGLLQESCKAHNKPNSFLLRWGEELDGEAGRALREEVLTFKQFEQFCIDLADYLEDMAYSAVKAKALFIELIKQSKEKNN